MPRNPHRHPDDVAAQRRLLTELITIRLTVTTQEQVADQLGITFHGVSVFEQQRAATAHCATISAYARAVDRRVEYRAAGIPWPKFELPKTADLLAQAGATVDPGEYDALMLEYVVRRAAAARRWLGLRAGDVGAAMGVSASAVNQVETGGHGLPMLSTLQRYLRAIGGRLETRLHVVPAAVGVAA